MSDIFKIQNYSQIQPLKEIWIGDCYPEKFYSNFDSKTEDIFCKITEMTKKELDNICKILNNLNVRVARPKFDQPFEKYLDIKGKLIKPPMAPQDWAMAIDDTLYINPQYYSGIEPFQHAIDLYRSHGQNVKILDRRKDPISWITFPSVVKLGRDIFIDYEIGRREFKENTIIFAEQLSANHRVYISNTGEHSDGVFCPIKEKEILSSFYRNKYNKSFPDWNVTFLDERPMVPSHNHKWWIPGGHYANYNDNIINVAETWLGNPWETIFSVNCILVDEKNILVIKEDKKIFKFFESIGITPHLAEFNMCYVWDSGLHCMSSDICREGLMPDYWPDRGDNGVYYINEQ